MAELVDFPGFHFDVVRAEAMADAIAAVFIQASLANVTVPDKLAALGIAAAREIQGSRLREDPQKGAQALAVFIVAWVTRLAPPAKPA